MRSSCAIPRASFRSVFTIIADGAALACRVSSSTASKPGRNQAGPQPLRQRPGLQPDPASHDPEIADEPHQRFRLAGHLRFPDNLAEFGSLGSRRRTTLVSDPGERLQRLVLIIVAVVDKTDSLDFPLAILKSDSEVWISKTRSPRASATY